MPLVQFYNDDGTARLFEKELTISLDHPERELDRRETTHIFRELGFKLDGKWIKMQWGWQAKFSRIRR